ncbi:predicted protein [Postia placenta Mad-698-R]|nr:predicted protein [Postia placenta Mad-698-R]
MTGIPAFVADKVNRKMDYITFNMRTNYNALRFHMPANIKFLRRDLRELWETNRLLIITHPDHLKSPLQYGTVYKYCIIAEDEHLPDSCTTMGHPITHSVMTAPCSYRSLGWHELNANLRLTMFRAGQKLSKRPLHYQHVLRGLLPYKEANHAYSIASQYMSWTIPVPSEMVPDRRLWATGEPSACTDGYFHWPVRQYCSPLSDDDAVRFSTPFRRIVSRLKRKRSGDTSMGTLAYTTKKSAQRAVSVRQWCLDCDQAQDEWTMGPPAEPEDAELLAYQQEKVGDVLPAVQDLWSLETHFSSTFSHDVGSYGAVGCISAFTSGCDDGTRLHALVHTTFNETSCSDSSINDLSTIWLNAVESLDMKIRLALLLSPGPYVDQPVGIGSSYVNLPKWWLLWSSLLRVSGAVKDFRETRQTMFSRDCWRITRLRV